MMKFWTIGTMLVFAIIFPAASFAQEPIIIGAAIAQTGPAASQGSDEVRSLKMLEKSINSNGGIAGHQVDVVILDTETSPQKAVLNVRKLINKFHAVGIICCTTTPESMAILDTVKESEVPNVSIAASEHIITPVSERYWIFKTVPNDTIMARSTIKDMKRLGVKTFGVLHLSDSYGQSGLAGLEEAADAAGIKVVAVEEFGNNDTNLSAQALRLVSAAPEAIVIWARSPSGNVAQDAIHAVGYQGIIYQSYGSANDVYLRLGGASINGTRIAVQPVSVYDQLPDSVPFKSVVLGFVKDYQAAYDGELPNAFAGYAYDALRIFSEAAKQVIANNKAEVSDIAAFRAALRDTIENMGSFQGVDGTFDITADDHMGLGLSSAVVAVIEDGDYNIPTYGGKN